jgi:iron complex transport system substrate-binding protein
MMFPPECIVCLTEETVETLYLLGGQDRIVGISGCCVRPPEARRDKLRVSAFTSADIPKIVGLAPDLVLSFSDLQADIVAALIRQGIAVHAFNQCTVVEIFDMIRVGAISELIEIAGGTDVFGDRAAGKSAKERIVRAEEVIDRQPEIIIGSSCGKKFRPERVARRPGFEQIPAVRNDALYEIKSPLILQPGSAALTDGLKACSRIIT